MGGATLLVDVTTSPVATSVAPGWDDENLTYTVDVTNDDGLDEATNVAVTSEFTLGGGTLVSSSASQGSCSGMTCSLGTIAPGEFATATFVVRPNAGTVKNKFTASSDTADSVSVIQTNTIRSSTPTAAIDWSMPQRARDLNSDG